MMKRILAFRKNVIFTISLIIGRTVAAMAESVHNGIYQYKRTGKHKWGYGELI